LTASAIEKYVLEASAFFDLYRVGDDQLEPTPARSRKTYGSCPGQASRGQCGKILCDSWLLLLALEFLTTVWRRALGDEAPRSLEPTTELLSSNFARGCVVSLLHSGVLCSNVEVAQAPLQRRAVIDRTAAGQREAGQYRQR
jgi:hypothetical protein